MESQGGNTDYNSKKLWEKSIAEISEELKKQNTNPSIDSYGEPNTFISYKLNKFYERTNIVELKKAKLREKHEFFRKVQKLQQERDNEVARLKRLEKIAQKRYEDQ